MNTLASIFSSQSIPPSVAQAFNNAKLSDSALKALFPSQGQPITVFVPTTLDQYPVSQWGSMLKTLSVSGIQDLSTFPTGTTTLNNLNSPSQPLSVNVKPLGTTSNGGTSITLSGTDTAYPVNVVNGNGSSSPVSGILFPDSKTPLVDFYFVSGVPRYLPTPPTTGGSRAVTVSGALPVSPTGTGTTVLPVIVEPQQSSGTSGWTIFWIIVIIIIILLIGYWLYRKHQKGELNQLSALMG